MAKRAKEAGNGYDPALMRDLMGQLDDVHAEYLSAQGGWMAQAKGIRAKNAPIYDEAKEKGVDPKVLRKLWNARLKIQAGKKVINDLERDDRQAAEMMADALGDQDTAPLFQFAKRRRRASGEAARAE